MKIKSLTIVFLVLAINLSCRLFYPDQYMFDQNNLEEAFALVNSKGFAKDGLAEIDITYNTATFDTGTRALAYAGGITREVKSESSPSSKKFHLEEIDLANFYQIITTVILLAQQNPYIDKPEIKRIVITKESVNRDDNLVSNIDKRRDAVRIKFNIGDADTDLQFTTNAQGKIVDIASTNVKPRIKFLDPVQMKKSVAEIKSLFGEKLLVADFTIQTENFSFTAADPKNPEEINVYRFDSQEFLNASRSPFQKTLEDKKREEEMRRGGTPEETIKMRSPQFIFFDIEEIDFSLIPQVMQKTLENAKSSNPKISGITIRKRQDQFSKIVKLEWIVETYGDRLEKETTIFDGKGNLKTGD